MKYVILVGDGMGDYPIPELGGKNPAGGGKNPSMDGTGPAGGAVAPAPSPRARTGQRTSPIWLSWVRPVYGTIRGRAPLEAAPWAWSWVPEVAFRCNLVTLRQEDSKLIMEDYAAGTSPAAKPEAHWVLEGRPPWAGTGAAFTRG